MSKIYQISSQRVYPRGISFLIKKPNLFKNIFKSWTAFMKIEGTNIFSLLSEFCSKLYTKYTYYHYKILDRRSDFLIIVS